MWSTLPSFSPPPLSVKSGVLSEAEAAFPTAHICLRLNDKSFFLPPPHSLACWAVSGDPGVASPGSYTQKLFKFCTRSRRPRFPLYFAEKLCRFFLKRPLLTRETMCFFFKKIRSGSFKVLFASCQCSKEQSPRSKSSVS